MFFVGKLKNEKHELFCQEYLIDLNAAAAYQRVFPKSKSDSSKANASRLIARDNVAARVDELKQKRSRRVRRTADDVLRDIEEIKNRCMQKEAVLERVDGRLVDSGEWKFDSRGALKAVELEGKHLKMWTEKHELSGSEENPVVVKEITRKIVRPGES